MSFWRQPTLQRFEEEMAENNIMPDQYLSFNQALDDTAASMQDHQQVIEQAKRIGRQIKQLPLEQLSERTLQITQQNFIKSKLKFYHKYQQKLIDPALSLEIFHYFHGIQIQIDIKKKAIQNMQKVLRLKQQQYQSKLRKRRQEQLGITSQQQYGFFQNIENPSKGIKMQNKKQIRSLSKEKKVSQQSGLKKKALKLKGKK